MPLAAGDRLGPYEIVAPLGAGGMGEVYCARDTRLAREVALKILRPEVANDPSRRQRFELEARAVAALNHPNIVAIYDVGDGYIVSELVDGEALRGAKLGLRKTLDIAVQIASGLAAAHAAGITHRDLKPANILLTREGRVKILDFGLAKIHAPPVAAAAAPAETVTVHTDPGVVMGTVDYMSPEQVRGMDVDPRSDIFSFGVILHELFTGAPAFRGETRVDTMQAILRQEPAQLPDTVPAGVRQIAAHCLEKDRANRFQSARDLAFALEAVAGSSLSSQSSAQPIVVKSARRFRLAGAAAALGLIALAVAGVLGYRVGRGSRAGTASFQPLTFRPMTIIRARFAPDGKTFVYSAALRGNSPEIFVVSADYPESRPIGIPKTDLLSVSSKGELAVLTGVKYRSQQQLYDGTLARMPLAGGGPREILEGVHDADWSPDGASLAIIHDAGGEDRLEFPVGKVLARSAPAGYLSDPRFSPSGDRIAFFEHPARGDDRGGVAMVDLQGKRTRLSDEYAGEEGLAWSPDGREILFSAVVGGGGSTYQVYAVDLSGRIRSPLAVPGSLTVQDISRDGQRLATRDDLGSEMRGRGPDGAPERTLSWLDGSTIHSGRSISRDGKMLLFTEGSPTLGNKYVVCLRGTDGSPAVRLGEGDAGDLSPDGKWATGLVFSSPPQWMLYPTGAGEPHRLPRGGIETYSRGAHWFPDGKSVLICGSEAGHASRCYSQEIAGGDPQPITPEGTTCGHVSPDGTQILACRTEGYVVYPRGGGEPRAVPVPDDADLIGWAAGGREVLFFRSREAPILVERVDLKSGRRTPAMTLAPPDLAGIQFSSGVTLSVDEKSYAYSFWVARSQLFLIQGAK
jgi:Tol biopolymer transport system component/predicted Ser/Thr protein kinase